MSKLLERAKQIKHGVESITDWLGSGGSVCEKQDAQERANICLGCDENKLGMAVSTPVQAAVKRILEVKNRLSLHVSGEKRLGRCKICTCELKLQIWQPQPQVKAELTDEEKENLPAHCWKLK